MRDMQTKEPPIITRQQDSSVSHTLVVQLLFEVNHRFFVLIAANHDRSISRTRCRDANRIFLTVFLHGRFVGSTSTNNLITWLCLIYCILQIEPRLFNRSISIFVVSIGRNIIGMHCHREGFCRNGHTHRDVSGILWFDRGVGGCRVQRNGNVIQIDGCALTSETNQHFGICLVRIHFVGTATVRSRRRNR